MILKDDNTTNNSVHISVEVQKKLIPGLSAPRSCCWICERVLVNPYIVPLTSAHNLHRYTQSFCKSAPIKQQTHLRLRWPEGLYIFSNFVVLGELLLYFYWTLLTLLAADHLLTHPHLRGNVRRWEASACTRLLRGGWGRRRAGSPGRPESCPAASGEESKTSAMPSAPHWHRQKRDG